MQKILLSWNGIDGSCVEDVIGCFESSDTGTLEYIELHNNKFQEAEVELMQKAAQKAGKLVLGCNIHSPDSKAKDEIVKKRERYESLKHFLRILPHLDADEEYKALPSWEKGLLMAEAKLEMVCDYFQSLPNATENDKESFAQVKQRESLDLRREAVFWVGGAEPAAAAGERGAATPGLEIHDEGGASRGGGEEDRYEIDGGAAGEQMDAVEAAEAEIKAEMEAEAEAEGGGVEAEAAVNNAPGIAIAFGHEDHQELYDKLKEKAKTKAFAALEKANNPPAPKESDSKKGKKKGKKKGGGKGKKKK